MERQEFIARMREAKRNKERAEGEARVPSSDQNQEGDAMKADEAGLRCISPLPMGLHMPTASLPLSTLLGFASC